jgi:hypothetical protein
VESRKSIAKDSARVYTFIRMCAYVCVYLPRTRLTHTLPLQIGLGSVRIAAAVQPDSKPIWALNLFMHFAEASFWWTEALEPITTAKIFEMQGYVANLTESSAPQIFKALLNGSISDPLIHVLLLGVPLLIVLILANFPSGSKGGAKGKSKSKRS